MKTLLWILTAVSVCACGNPDAFDVDSELSADFDRASAVWCDGTGCCPYQDSDGRSRAVLDDEITVCVDCDGAYEHHGEAGTIHVLSGLSADEQYSVILHEIGHHCGCWDSEDERNVMAHATGARGLSPTESDVACAR